MEFSRDGRTHRVGAGSEVLLSLGAIHTPKLLMQSGVGDCSDMQRHGIPVVEHLPGVGKNLQDHPGFGLTWELPMQLPVRNTGAEALFFWKSDAGLDTPDVQACLSEFPFSSGENGNRFGMPDFGWSWFAGVVRPKSRGVVRLTGPDPLDPVQIDANLLSHPDDLTAAVACVELCREIGNSAPLRPFVQREVMPGDLRGAELIRFLRDAVVTYWHQSCTAKMGRDDMSVVDGELKSVWHRPSSDCRRLDHAPCHHREHDGPIRRDR